MSTWACLPPLNGAPVVAAERDTAVEVNFAPVKVRWHDKQGSGVLRSLVERPLDGLGDCAALFTSLEPTYAKRNSDTY